MTRNYPPGPPPHRGPISRPPACTVSKQFQTFCRTKTASVYDFSPRQKRLSGGGEEAEECLFANKGSCRQGELSPPPAAAGSVPQCSPKAQVPPRLPAEGDCIVRTPLGFRRPIPARTRRVGGVALVGSGSGGLGRGCGSLELTRSPWSTVCNHRGLWNHLFLQRYNSEGSSLGVRPLLYALGHSHLGAQCPGWAVPA